MAVIRKETNLLINQAGGITNNSVILLDIIITNDPVSVNSLRVNEIKFSDNKLIFFSKHFLYRYRGYKSVNNESFTNDLFSPPVIAFYTLILIIS